MKIFKITLLATSLLTLLASTPTQAQNHQWTKTFGVPQVTTEIAISRAIALDQNGNVLTVGTFIGTVDFDPGAGVASLTSTSGESGRDVYISKLNAAGNFIWAKRLGGIDDINFPNSANGSSITTDLSGNLIVAGSFSGMIDINPDPAIELTLSSPGGTDGFILKLNPNGDYLWSQQISSAGGETVNSVTTDATGNIFATGSFASTVDFDPGAANTNTLSAGQSDIFVLKLLATGTFGFVKTFGGTTTEVGNAITVDGAGNIYTTGFFGNGAAGATTDFDPSAGIVTLTSKGGADIFISKLNSLGNYVWAQSFGSTVTTLGADAGNAITTDEQGNVYVAGTFRATNVITPVDFDPGAGVDNKFVVGAQDVFVTKLDASGNYVFSFTAGSTTNDLPYAIAIDAEDNINIIGSYSGAMDFDPDPAVDNILTPVPTTGGTNSTDLFVAKYDATGAVLNVNTIGSNATDIGYGLVIDGASNIFITGIFSGIADFDPSAATVNIVPAGIQDGFVTKWNSCGNTGGLPTNVKTKAKMMGLNNLPTIFANTSCDIIAKVTPSGASPIAGNTTAKVWVETTQPNAPTGKFVKRHYEITPAANATTATGKVTLYFTQQDFNDFNAVSSLNLPTNPTDIMGKSNLLIEKKAGISNNGTGLPSSYTNGTVNIDPLDSDIIWNAGTQRWEVSFNTTGFSGFFVKTQTSVLPVRLQNFTGDINKQNQATLSWNVQEIDVLKYEVEKSNNGIDFETLKTVNSIGNGEHNYSIIDIVKKINTVYYRLKLIDLSGYYTYSNVIILQPYTSKQVSVYPNPAKDFVTISVGNDYLKTTAQITDLNGKVVKSINITNASSLLDMALLPAGVYFLKMENGKTEKIVKQ